MSDEPAADVAVAAGIAGRMAVGARVGGYQLERLLGQGGMAAVYVARDDRLGRLVALKVLAPALDADEAFRTRFIRESRAAAAVDHPHIIPVFDAGDVGGLLYIAMRYVPGGDVGTIVRREGPLSPARVAAMIAQVASALDAAHAAGLVHRDVKPANMLVDVGSGRSEHVYLSDFGLSKKTLAASAGLTGTGQFLGTLDYVAPEQIQGRPTDGRTDQYGLGCAAFELLAGAPPFRREEAAAVMYAHLSDPPPPVTSRRAGLSPGVDQVVARALAKEPSSRYSSCQEFADALLDALGAAPPDSRPPASEQDEPAPHHPPTRAASVSDRPAPATDAAASMARPLHAEAGPPTGDTDIPAAAATADTAAPPSQTVSPPGMTISGPQPGPALQPATPQLATTAVPVSTPRSASPSPSRTPRSRSRWWLLAAAATAVIVGGVTALAVSLSGGQPTTSGTHSPAGPTGGQAASGPITGSLAAILKNPKYAPVRVAFVPGASTLAVGSQGANVTNGATYLWDTATKSITATLTDPGGDSVNALAFGPDGTTLAVGDANHRTYLWDTATASIVATLTDPVSQGVSSVAFGPDGTTLATGDFTGSTYLWDTATSSVTATLTDPGNQIVSSVAFGPDVSTLAVGSTNARNTDGATYLWDTATKSITATLTDPGTKGVSTVAFEPDGTTLVVGDFNGSTYLWDTATMSITATLTDPGSTGVSSVAFGPGGTTLAVGDFNGSTYLWDTATRSITTTLTDPGSQGVSSVAFGPGGTSLAACDGDGRTYLWNLARHSS